MNIYSALQDQTVLRPTSTGSSTVETKTAAEKAADDAEQQKTEFLELLLTQLANQNPLDPMDTDDFTAQLTRYSILEQGIETNANLAVTNDLLEQSSLSSSFSYIGKNIEMETRTSTISGGLATWSYEIDGSPSEVYLTITDENGTNLGEYEGSIAAGAHTFTLDTAGADLPDGTPLYLSVNAKDGDGESLDSTITSNMVVDGIWSDGNQSYLTSGEVSFLASDILKVINNTTTTTVSSSEESNSSDSENDTGEETAS